eukprot:9503762-Pyramimonas_sp.AAC.2
MARTLALELGEVERTLYWDRLRGGRGGSGLPRGSCVSNVLQAPIGPRPDRRNPSLPGGPEGLFRARAAWHLGFDCVSRCLRGARPVSVSETRRLSVSVSVFGGARARGHFVKLSSDRSSCAIYDAAAYSGSRLAPFRAPCGVARMLLHVAGGDSGFRGHATASAHPCHCHHYHHCCSWTLDAPSPSLAHPPSPSHPPSAHAPSAAWTSALACGVDGGRRRRAASATARDGSVEIGD